jgi:RNA-binding protein YlmH
MNDYLIKLARNDDEKRLVARLNELVQKAAQGISGTSNFLDLRQQELARAAAVNGLGIAWQLDGGYEEAERKRLLVYPEWETDPNARLVYLRVSHKEFKEQSIGHRDYLGAIL